MSALREVWEEVRERLEEAGDGLRRWIGGGRGRVGVGAAGVAAVLLALAWARRRRRGAKAGTAAAVQMAAMGQLVQWLLEGKVEAVHTSPKAPWEVLLSPSSSSSSPSRALIAVTPAILALYQTKLADALAARPQVRVVPRVTSWTQALPSVLLLLMPALYLFLLYHIMMRVQNPKENIAKRRRRITRPTTFADVAGIDHVVQEVNELVTFLRSPDKYTHIGARFPRGVLLHGPAGTGKTLVARAVAGEAGVPFLSCSASDFVEMLVGRGASRVRNLFQRARRCAPSIIFIDELDALGKSRGGVNTHDEREQTLNQLLTCMDGFEADEVAGRPVLVMAATNRAEILDSALCRPGRFDRIVHVGLPDAAARLAILRVHIRSVKLEPTGVDLAALAAGSAGLSGADLANVVNEAALLAVRDGANRVAQQHLDLALAKVVSVSRSL